MGSSKDDGGGTSPGEKKAAETLSQFLARILDQLSLTSWLPALALVGIVLVLAQISRKRGSLAEAFSAIGDMGFASLVLLGAAVVVSSIFTQAFEFAVIRLVEGYWPPSGPLGRYARWRSRRHRTKCASLQEDYQRIRRSAAESMQPKLREAGHRTGVFDALVSKVANVPMPEGVTRADKAKAAELEDDWKTFADPGLVQQFEGIERRIEEYPELSHRVLPTRLGNIIRAVEDKLRDPAAEGRLETYILHIFDDLPAPTQQTYLENRRRLDLYCGLVVVFAAAIVPSAVLGQFYDADHWATGLAVPGAIAALTFVTYRAALASGRTFGLALHAVKEQRSAHAVNAAGSSSEKAVSPAS